jgi:hypothetical protein
MFRCKLGTKTEVPASFVVRCKGRDFFVGAKWLKDGFVLQKFGFLLVDA